MLVWIKRLLSRFSTFRFIGLFRNQFGALGQLGWKQVDFDRLRISGNQPAPWLVYGATDFIEHVVGPDWTVLELGGGASTAFWMNRGNRVVLVESDEKWAKRIEANFPDNSLLETIVTSEIDLNELEKLGLGHFDVISIDFSGNRGQVADWALRHLNTRGLIVWDNSERPEYASGLNRLKSSGLGWVSFFGLGPINSYAWETTVFSPILPKSDWKIRSKNYI